MSALVTDLVGRAGPRLRRAGRESTVQHGRQPSQEDHQGDPAPHAGAGTAQHLLSSWEIMFEVYCKSVVYSSSFLYSSGQVPGISAVPDENNARYFHVVVAGPEGSPFEGGVFKLELFLPEDYPMSAPKVSSGPASLLPRGTDCDTGSVHHSYLPPQHRQAGEDLPGHPQGQMEPSTTDPHSTSLHPGNRTPACSA